MPRKISRVFQNVSHSNNELTHEIGTTCDAVVSQADANVRILKGVGEGVKTYSLASLTVGAFGYAWEEGGDSIAELYQYQYQ